MTHAFSWVNGPDTPRLDLVEIGLVSADETSELHAVEPSALPVPPQSRRRPRSLSGHCDPESLIGRDQVVGVVRVFAEVDLDPVDRAGEDAAFALVVVADRGRGVLSDVGGLI